MSSFPVCGSWRSFRGNAVTWRSPQTSERGEEYDTTDADSDLLLVLVSVSLGSALLYADTKSMTDYDLKTLAIVVNRDLSDITVSILLWIRSSSLFLWGSTRTRTWPC